MTKSTDYDAPRTTDPVTDTVEDSLDELKARRTIGAEDPIDPDESGDEVFELPGADLSDEQLTVQIVPCQADEFTCSRCFLVHHRSRLGGEKNGVYCQDCA